MKRIFAILLLLFITTGESFAYLEKIYNDKGYLIGTARKNGDDYIFYDLEGNEVKDFDAFYASPGDPDRRKMKELTPFYGQDIYGNVIYIPKRPYRIIRTGF